MTQIESYLTVKENINNLPSELVCALFLDLLIEDKINFIELTNQYVEYNKIELKKQIEVTRGLGQEILSVVYSKKKDLKESLNHAVDKVEETNMFNTQMAKSKLL